MMPNQSPDYMRGSSDALAGMANGISVLLKRDTVPDCCRKYLEALRAAASTASSISEVEAICAEGS
jgi:hypothetical protein